MASEEKIINKIIPIETILEVANYLEDQKEEYLGLYRKEEQKNMGLKFTEQVYEYKGENTKVEYTIRFKDGKEITEANYNWFVGMLNNLNAIEKIEIHSYISYASNTREKGKYEYMRLYTHVYFREDSITISVDGKNMEEQVHRVHSYLRGIIENNDDRYNKTVKNRKLRIQSLCLSIGFVLSYIIYFILIANKNKIPDILSGYLDNKMIIIIGQWFVSAVVGNILGLPIMLALYRNILPKTKYSHYSKSSHKSVYVDNIEDFIAHDEVQIGKFANNGKNRKIIEKVYKVTSKIVVLQLLVSIVLFFVLK